MPCGDSNAFPSQAFTTIGNALVNKQFSLALLAPACDVVLFVASKIPGGADPTPIPFPKPTFGAGLESCSDDECVEAGRMMLSLCEQDEAADGAKMAPNLGTFPWKTVLNVLMTVLQGVFVALGDRPIPTPAPAPAPAPDQK